MGGEERAMVGLWGVGALVFLFMGVAAFYRIHAALIVAFVLLDTLQNCWRPVQLSRLDSHSREAQGATILSIESQAQHATTMVAAPLLGLAVNMARTQSVGGMFMLLRERKITTDPDLPPVTEGRIGLRHMFTRSARYRNISISVPE
jgi:hypothetical protein